LDLAHLHAKFGGHPGLHRVGGRPVVYVYDSYHQAPAEWARLLAPGGDLSVRGAPADAHFIGLWLERGHGSELRAGGFDGAYTYFAADGFSYGASSQHWPAMAAEAAAKMVSRMETHPALGEVPTAFVALKPGAHTDSAALLAHCKVDLAYFKVPDAVAILPELPKGPTGKILRRELRQFLSKPTH
jgi:acyl-CoA synthetase (AMP-forming)/AMP-acid ligase II